VFVLCLCCRLKHARNRRPHHHYPTKQNPQKTKPKQKVQAALHANQTGELPGPWQDCTEAISYSRSDLLTSMLPVWRELLDRGGAAARARVIFLVV
jgi:hypothetical protein